MTGASSGIGRLLAKELSPHTVGWTSSGLSPEPKQRLFALGEELPVPVRAFALDLTAESSITTLQERLADEQPVVRLLINASGYGKFERVRPAFPKRDAAGMVDLNCRARSRS